MKIRSTFHDYYDALMTHDTNDIIYDRFPRKELVPGLFPSTKGLGTTSRFRCQGIVVGFCGQIYPAVKLTDFSVPSFSKICYSIEDVDAFVENRLSKKEYEVYLAKKADWRFYRRLGYFNIAHRDEFIEHFDMVADGWKKDYNKHFKNRTPIFVYSYNDNIYWKTDGEHGFQIVYNGSLREVDFFRVFDVQQTFQEIEMWLNNQAVPLKPIPKIDDKTMAEAKGFDKFSFRKESKCKK